MRTSKSWIITICMLVLFGFSASASGVDYKDPKDLSQQFTKLLKGLDADNLADGKTVYVDFMMNAKGEIIVLSTNNQKLDERIKNKLNYKKIRTTELTAYQKYTLPISFKR